MKKISIFLFLFVSILTNAQTFTLNGIVVDENKEPLPGATILVKETNKGTSTDFDGKFSVNFPKGKYTIQVSFIGYKTVSKEISFSSHLERKIHTYKFSQITEAKNIKDKQIDFINIDAEAHDFEVLEGIDLDIYKAKLICIEMLDFENKINEKKFQNYLTKYNYNLIKIIGPNGIFELKN